MFLKVPDNLGKSSGAEVDSKWAGELVQSTEDLRGASAHFCEYRGVIADGRLKKREWLIERSKLNDSGTTTIGR